MIGAHKCMGTVLVVDPQWSDEPPAPYVFTPDAALFALEGPAVMISALAAETWTLSKLLGQAINWLGDPWSPAAQMRDTSQGGVATSLPTENSHTLAVL